MAPTGCAAKRNPPLILRQGGAPLGPADPYVAARSVDRRGVAALGRARRPVHVHEGDTEEDRRRVQLLSEPKGLVEMLYWHVARELDGSLFSDMFQAFCERTETRATSTEREGVGRIFRVSWSHEKSGRPWDYSKDGSPVEYQGRPLFSWDQLGLHSFPRMRRMRI